MTVFQLILTILVIVYCIILNNNQYESWKNKEIKLWIFYMIAETVMIIVAILMVYDFIQG